MQVKIKYLHPDAKTPTYATDGSACFDLYAAEVTGGIIDISPMKIEYSEPKPVNTTFTTGLAFEIPENHVMLVFSRSGHGFKEGASLINCVGVIDSDYRGEVAVKMNKPIKAGVGDRIAQAMIIPVQQVTFQVTDDLTETKRGQGGFGSTGVK